MLKFYFTTVLIWMVIINAVLKITVKTISENGWTDKPELTGKKNSRKKREAIAIVAAIPVIRFFVVVTAFYMMGIKKEDGGK